MSSNFRYEPFVAVSGNLGGEVSVVDDVLWSDEQEIYPSTLLDENCIEFEFQTDRNFYVDLRQTYLALKLKFVKGPGYGTYNSKEVKKGAQTRGYSGCGSRLGGARCSSSSRYSCKQHFALNFFQCWSVHQQSANLQFKWMVCAQVLHFKQLQAGHLWIQGSVSLRGVWLWRISWWNYGSASVWTLFHKKIVKA